MAGMPARNIRYVRYDAGWQRLLGVTGSGEIFSTRDDGQNWSPAGDPGWDVRRVSVAGERLLGITAFSGIVAQPELAPAQRAAVPAGSSQ